MSWGSNQHKDHIPVISGWAIILAFDIVATHLGFAVLLYIYIYIYISPRRIAFELED